MKKLLLSFVFVAAGMHQLFAQCAMCRATLENNVSNGNAGLAANLNFGILYLFAMPYIAAMVLGLLWLRASKKNRRAAIS